MDEKEKAVLNQQPEQETEIAETEEIVGTENVDETEEKNEEITDTKKYIRKYIKLVSGVIEELENMQ